jgi:hypothetical protein
MEKDFIQSSDLDFNNLMRLALVNGLRFIPEAGPFISGLVSLLWKEDSSQEDVWNTIKERVEALVDKKISTNNLEQLKLNLIGLKNVVDDYTLSASDKGSSKQYISEKFNIAIGQFESLEPFFMAKEDDPQLFIPLFTQFSNLYLGILREGAIFGTEWTWSEVDVKRTRQKLTSKIQEYSTYVEVEYQKGKLAITGQSLNYCLNWDREMILTVLDFKYYWQFFDKNLSKTDSFTIPKLTREIFSDIRGSNGGVPYYYGITLPNQKYGFVPDSNEHISKLEAYGWERLDGFKIWCGSKLITDRTDGGGSCTTNGWSGEVSKENPITKIHTEADDCVVSTTLIFKNGDTALIGGLDKNKSRNWKTDDSFDGHILSNVYIPHINKDSVGCIIYCFRLEDSFVNVELTGFDNQSDTDFEFIKKSHTQINEDPELPIPEAVAKPRGCFGQSLLILISGIVLFALWL